MRFSLKQFWKHRFFFSVTLSETGSMYGFTLRTVWCLATLASLGAGLSAYIYHKGDTGLGLPVAFSNNVDKLKSEIARLKRENTVHQQQLRVFAEEIGILQSKTDRFDMITERLFNDDDIGDMLQEDVDALSGKGSVDAPVFDRDVSLEELQDQFATLKKRTMNLDGLMDNALELVNRNYLNRANRPSVWPVVSNRTRITSKYGTRTDPFSGTKRWHSGVDIGGGWDAPIISSGDGIVTYAGYRYGYGVMVEVAHPGGFATRYAHLNKALASNGQKVKAGDTIGLMGSTGRSTGPHLHYEVLVNDSKVDPYPFIADDLKRMRRYASNAQNVKTAKQQASTVQRN